MFLVGILLALFVLLFVVPLVWLAPRWGTPYPTAYRRRRGARYTSDISDVDVPVDSAHDQTSESWGYWADILWFVGAILLIALVIALVA